MNYVKSSEEMFRTTDYEGFKRVIGNRRVMEERVTKILASIDKIGYIPIPLIVNEKMEVIDGQGRLEACKRRGLPVNFIIKPGLRIQDCITMNINVTPWNLTDFILCYAEMGNESYQLMVKLLEEISSIYGSKNMSINALCTALFGTKKAPSNAVKAGRLIVTEESYEYARDCLKYVFDIIVELSNKKARLQSNNVSNLLTAIMFCYRWEQVDNTKLKNVLLDKAHLMQKWTNVETCLQEIEYIYNYNSRKPSVYLKRLYEDLSDKDSQVTNFIATETNLKSEDEE